MTHSLDYLGESKSTVYQGFSKEKFKTFICFGIHLKQNGKYIQLGHIYLKITSMPWLLTCWLLLMLFLFPLFTIAKCQISRIAPESLNNQMSCRQSHPFFCRCYIIKKFWALSKVDYFLQTMMSEAILMTLTGRFEILLVGHYIFFGHSHWRLYRLCVYATLQYSQRSAKSLFDLAVNSWLWEVVPRSVINCEWSWLQGVSAGDESWKCETGTVCFYLV